MKSSQNRFWAKVARAGPENCWIWTAYRLPDGYGQFRIEGRTVRAHRFSYELSVGPIPNGLCVLHHCDNPPCVNPAHLWIGTQIDNLRDRDAKWRQARGRHHGRAKLTEKDVQKIRLDNRTAQIIAADYGVSGVAISLIKNRQRWAHLP